jgi:protein-disulfide isomerase
MNEKNIIEKEPEKEKDEWLENLIAVAISAIVVLVILGLIFGWFSSEPEEDPNIRYNVMLNNDPQWGESNAPVTIIEFSDFQCPYCAWFATEIKPQLQPYIDSGEVRFIYRDFPLSRIHPKAAQLAKAAGCADEQGLFWPYHDLLYANPEALEINNLREYAEEAELNLTMYDTCFASDHRFIEIESDIQDGIDASVTSTPTFFINGRKRVGAMEFEELETMIQEELALTSQ